MKKYKVLNADLKSPFQSFQFEIGKKYHCENFDDDIKKDCSNGFYATDIDGLPYSFRPGRKVFLSEVSGKSVEINLYKKRYEEIELIKEIPYDEVKKLALEKEIELEYKLSKILFPINPFLLPEQNINDIDIQNLKQWYTLWDTLGNTIGNTLRYTLWYMLWYTLRNTLRDTLGNTLGNTLRNTLGNTLGNTLRNTLWDTIYAYSTSFFPNIKKWKCIDHPCIDHPEGVNPFQCVIDLWNRGFLPSFDGNTWRLHSGKNAKIVYEVKS